MNKNIKTKEELKKEIDKLFRIAIALFVICIPCVAIAVISSITDEHIIEYISLIIGLACVTYWTLLGFYLKGIDVGYNCKE